MEKLLQPKNENTAKGNSEDSLLVIYILRILKKYSSPQKALSSQDVMDYLRKDYSIGNLEKADAQRKKVRRHLDTLCEFYQKGCIKKVDGKTRNGHKWYYDALRDKFAKEDGVVIETLSKEEIDFVVDIIASSKIINSVSTISIIQKLLKKGKHTKNETRERLRKIVNEEWSKSINKELLLIKQDIQLCIDDVRKIRFDYENKKSILATPYGWGSDQSGKYILIAKVDGGCEGEFTSFNLEKIQNVEKTDILDYNDFDDTYFDKGYGTPDVLSMESLFANIQIITTAIEEKSGIEFKYLSYVIQDARVVVEGKEKRVLPHRLVFHNGKYYLIGYDEQELKVDYYRVDLISKLGYSSTKIKISDFDARVLSGLQGSKEVEKHPLMLAGRETLTIFKVVESALDRVIDAFAVKPNQLTVTQETRTVKDASAEGFHQEKLVSVQIITTYEEAFRWALANADVVELVYPQTLRDKLGRISEPIYQLYTQTLPDKVRENLDYVLKEGTFKISAKVDEDTAFATYKELANMGSLGVVDNIFIAGHDNDFDNLDYLGDFINTNQLTIKAPNLKNASWASKLVNVTALTLEDSEMEDLSWMKEMKKLKYAGLSNSSFSDLSVLSGHKNINILDINGTNISDISFIENCSNLEQLLIATCPIDDYSPLFTTHAKIKYLEIDKRALERIGEEKIRSRHIGMHIKTTSSVFFWL